MMVALMAAATVAGLVAAATVADRDWFRRWQLRRLGLRCPELYFRAGDRDSDREG